MTIPVKHQNRHAKKTMVLRQFSLIFAISLIAVFTPVTGEAAKLTKEVCEKDYAELIAEIERNRQAGIDQINTYLAETRDKKKRQELIEMREKSWDQEEEQRGLARNIFRDCMAAVK